MGKHPRLTRYLFVIGGLVLLLVVLVGIKGAQIGSLMAMGKEMQAMGPPPEAVGTTKAQGETWETTLTAVGSVSSLRSVTLSPEVSGLVSQIRFESGAIAKEGQVLVELDAGVERAQLASAAARRDLADKTAKRSEVLSQGNVISKAQYDDTQTQLRAAQSDLQSLKAQIDRKVVRAPFKGRLGIRAVNPGQYVTPGTTITTLDAIGGTFVDFTLAAAGSAVGPRRAAGAGVVRRIARRAPTGTITAVDPTVDPTTRNAKIRAERPGADRQAAAGHVRQRRRWCCPRSGRWSPCRRRRSCTRPTATRCSWSSRRSRARQA